MRLNYKLSSIEHKKVINLRMGKYGSAIFYKESIHGFQTHCLSRGMGAHAHTINYFISLIEFFSCFCHFDYQIKGKDLMYMYNQSTLPTEKSTYYV